MEVNYVNIIKEKNIVNNVKVLKYANIIFKKQIVNYVKV